ncbi:MAG: hypothetical protein GYA21_14270 [Myxococcales bacterium]|nr:hypothetical protein [Myxococcales bacterium]
MIKKIIVLAVLAAAGYVGYLVWNNLNPKERKAVQGAVSGVVEKTKEVAQDAASVLTDKTRALIKDNAATDKPTPERAPPPSATP